MPPPAAVAPLAPCDNHTTTTASAAACSNASSSLDVCVIGSGIAGLSAAWLLAQTKRTDNKSASDEAATTSDATDTRPIRVCLYEKAASLGMDAEAMDADVKYVDSASGEPRTVRMRLDMPLRVFTESYYPHLTGLYDTVGVEYQPEDYSGSFSTYEAPSSPSSSAADAARSTDTAAASSPSSPAQLFFGYRNLLVGKLSVPLVFLPLWRSMLTVSSWRILRDLIRFHWQARRQLCAWSEEGPDAGCDITLGEYLDARNYSSDFTERMLVPTLAGILTCSHASVRAYPAPIVLAYWCKRSLRGVRRVCAGTQSVVTNLTRHVEVRLATGVRRVAPFVDAATGRTRVRVTDEHGGVRDFDHVVVACQANHAVEMLQQDCKDVALIDALRGVKYEQSRLITHSDPSLMPRDRDVWNSVNFILPPTSANDRTADAVSNLPHTISDEGMATIWLNRSQSNLRALGPDATPLFQSWNPITNVLPDPALTLHDATFERPVVTPHSLRCIDVVASRQGESHIWFCGSYAERGMPLLETAVASAVKVAKKLGQACPWESEEDAKNHEHESRPTSTHARALPQARRRNFLGLSTFGAAAAAIAIGAAAVFAQKRTA